MANRVLDPAISALKSRARELGSESVMTTDENGNTIILIGADDPDKSGRLAACMLQIEQQSRASR